MSLGTALANDLARTFGMLLAVALLLPILAFAAGWYCGDRWNVPTVTIVATP